MSGFHSLAAITGHETLMKNLTKLLALLALCLAMPVFAQSDLSSQPGTRAVVRGLDKVTATTHDFELELGKKKTFGSLTLELSYCRKRPPEEVPEVYAFLTITDRKTDGSGAEAEGEMVFNGWMFASSPALNPLEHPVYDVWILDCK
jgi:hypothetical protein